MKKKLLSLALSLALALTSAALPAFAATTADLKQQRETEHFVFYCTDQDVEALDDLEASLEGCYERTTTDLGKAPSGKTRVNIYPDIDSFHNATGRPNAPATSVGSGMNGVVYITSPLNPGPNHGYKSIIQIAVHEFVHIIVEQFHRSQPSYLNEGIACYETPGQTNIAISQEDIEQDTLPSLSTLETLNSSSNSRYNVYTYGPAYVIFIEKSFGFDKVISLLEGKDRSTVLGVSDSELNELWLAFLKREYGVVPNLRKADSWARSEVERAVRDGIVPASLQDNYKDTITRAQFAALAVKLYEAMSGETAPAPGENPFSDTSDPVVIQANALGIVKGSGGKFSPDNPVTRQEVALMLCRVYTKLGGTIPQAADTSFADNSEISPWVGLKDAIAFMADKGIVTGSGGWFRPKGNASIQEAIAIARRMFETLDVQ